MKMHLALGPEGVIVEHVTPAPLGRARVKSKVLCSTDSGVHRLPAMPDHVHVSHTEIIPHKRRAS